MSSVDSMATIKGTVTRVIPNSNNFFMRPEAKYEVALRHVDVDGHRVGDGELSAANLNARSSKFKAWTHDLPEVGDTVEIELIKEPE